MSVQCLVSTAVPVFEDTITTHHSPEPAQLKMAQGPSPPLCGPRAWSSSRSGAVAAGCQSCVANLHMHCKTVVPQ